MKATRFLRDGATVLLGIVLAIGAGEMLLRALWPQRSPVTIGMFREDADAGYALRSDYRNEVRVPEFTIAIRTDSEGYRVPAAGKDLPEEAVRLLALGDSFTFGVGVEAEEAFPEVLEDLLSQAGENVVVRNGGVGGYGPLRTARHFFGSQARWKPDVVLHAIYVGNDLADAHPHTYLQSPVIRDGRMTVPGRSAWTDLRLGLRTHSHLYAFLRRRTYDLYQASPLADASRHLDPMGRAEWPAEIVAKHWPAGRAALRELAEWSREEGVPYLVVLIPTKYQVEDQAWVSTASGGAVRRPTSIEREPSGSFAPRWRRKASRTSTCWETFGSPRPRVPAPTFATTITGPPRDTASPRRIVAELRNRGWLESAGPDRWVRAGGTGG